MTADWSGVLPWWPYQDPPNVAVYAVRAIADRRLPILVVHHDDDGEWQFQTDTPEDSDENVMVVALREILDLDQTVTETADLPCGWTARRSSPGAEWLRSVMPPT